MKDCGDGTVDTDDAPQVNMNLKGGVCTCMH